MLEFGVWSFFNIGGKSILFDPNNLTFQVLFYMEDINKIYKVEDGYPLFKVYSCQHFYHHFCEFELSKRAIAKDFKCFFETIEEIVENFFKKQGKYQSYSNLDAPIVKFRFFLKKTNNNFFRALDSFFKKLSVFEKKYHKKININVFHKPKAEILQLSTKYHLDTTVFPKSAYVVEKIEWYWEIMNEYGSPKIRFNPISGEVFVFGEASGEPLSRTYIFALLDWFEKYFKNQGEIITIILSMNYDYYYVDKSIQDFINECSKKFNTNQVIFIWYNLLPFG